MKAVLVDDEYYALQGLKMELEDLGGIEVVGMYEDGRRLIADLPALSFDILFLDIEMPGMNGFELLERLMESGCTPGIVFVTAYSHYAVKAFEVNAVDYIVKPVTRARLTKTLERINPEAAVPADVRLEVQCFRHFTVLAGGRVINSGWRTRKAEELMAYLLCEKGRFVSKEKIADALWPELDGEKGVANLYLAYYYIRKQEKSKGVRIPVESERGKMRLCLDHVEADMIRFEEYYEAAFREGQADPVGLMEKAVALYGGMLFEDGYYPWAAEYQQRYEIACDKMMIFLTDHYRQAGDTEKLRFYEEKLNNR